MTTDGDQEQTLVPISAIEHWSYCPRQCALIHVEQTFDENLYTIRGRLAHERVDSGEDEVDGDLVVLRALPLWSDRHGLVGKADVVEMRPSGPYPVEYKVGPPHSHHADLQLCAQALCLEEMTGSKVPRGATYHHATRRRREVVFSRALRDATIAITGEIRKMLDFQEVPAPVADSRCRSCSLADSCQPTAMHDLDARRRWDSGLFRPLPLGDPA